MAKFTKSEFACKCGCGTNEIKDDFVDLLNVMGKDLPFPLTVSSGYRCPNYNDKVSSTGRNGPHTTGRAADLLASHENAYTLLVAALRYGFVGVGVNQKESSRFIHLDDSKAHPRPRVWSY